MGAEPGDRPDVHSGCAPCRRPSVSGPGPRDPRGRPEPGRHQGAEKHTQQHRGRHRGANHFPADFGFFWMRPLPLVGAGDRVLGKLLRMEGGPAGPKAAISA